MREGLSTTPAPLGSLPAASLSPAPPRPLLLTAHFSPRPPERWSLALPPRSSPTPFTVGAPHTPTTAGAWAR